MGRRPIGDQAMSDAERQRRRRERLQQAAGGKPKAAQRQPAKPAPPSSELIEARKEIKRLKAELVRERAQKGKRK
jgi:hypothetical protein